MLNREDQELVSGILRGKEKSLRRYYQTYSPLLLAFIRRKIGVEEEVQDILQETFMASLEALRDFHGQSKLSTFLCAIASHKVVDHYRKKRIKKILFSQIPEIEKIISTLLGPEDQLTEELLKEQIKKTMKLIAPPYVRILNLKYIEGYSVLEIAEKLSISFKSAESLLFRARKAFAAAYVE